MRVCYNKEVMEKGYVDVVLGLQWGDEGKGRIVHYLSKKYSMVVRFQGGANAGHTVYIKGNKNVLHLIPTGILHEGPKVAIASGVVLDPEVLAREIGFLESEGIRVRGRYFVDYRTPIVFPFHKEEDSLFEQKKGIGTTRRGIAPAYRDVYQRVAIRAGDILHRGHFEDILKKQIEFNNVVLRHFGKKELKEEEVIDWFNKYKWTFEDSLTDVTLLIKEEIERGGRVLMEGAQGTLLDIFYGNYPYVTSSHTVLGGALSGAGFDYSFIRRVYGVFKAYLTRVGKGPFPTEIDDEYGQRIARIGDEYGATTGRKRRVGWLDLPLLRYAMWINGVTHPIMTKLDVLEGFSQVKLASAYKLEDKIYENIPPLTYFLREAEPVYEEFSDFDNIKEARVREEFSDGVKRYIKRIEEFIGAKIAKISKGTDNELI